MDFLSIQDQLKIDMVRTSQGCPEQCAHCGAYENGFQTKDLRVTEAPLNELADILMRTVGGTRKRIKDWLASDITTDVNTEPLQTKGFTDFAKLINGITNGDSKVIAISHGVRKNVRPMYDELHSVVDLMKRDIVRNFILTMDFERLKGKIDKKTNEDSYMETLEALKPVLSLPEAQVTVSLQGVSDSTHPQSLSRVEEMYTGIVVRLLDEFHWDADTIGKIHIDKRKSYTRIGRSEILVNTLEAEDCDVIPDGMLVSHIRSKGTPKFRGRIDGFRRVLEAQPLRAGITYGDTVDPRRWEKILSFD